MKPSGSEKIMKNNSWQKLFGAKRRAIDRKILEDCEKTITPYDLSQIELEVEREERARDGSIQRVSEAQIEEERVRIARTFGRPPLTPPKT
jgi:hypothetical protein